MPTALDVAFALFVAVLVAGVEAAHFDRKFRAAVAAGAPHARRNAYRRAVIGQWTLALAAVALWAREGRAWRALGVVPAGGWRLGVGVALVALVVAFTRRQVRAIARLDAARADAIRPRVRDVEFLMPHTRAEGHWFTALSVTAGVCEELLYRGFITWVVATYVGRAAAMVLVSIGFGLAHAYQGPRGIVKTGVVGLVMSGIVAATGWLVPAMIVHALVDYSAGVLGLTVFGTTRPATLPAAA